MKIELNCIFPNPKALLICYLSINNIRRLADALIPLRFLSESQAVPLM